MIFEILNIYNTFFHNILRNKLILHKAIKLTNILNLRIEICQNIGIDF